MTPRLPPELLQEILALTVQDQKPADQQLTRNKFRRVCKDWLSSFDYWKEIAVVGPVCVSHLVTKLKLDQLEAEASQDRRSPLRLRVQSVHIDTTLVQPAPVVTAMATSAMGSVLELLPELRRLTLLRDGSGIEFVNATNAGLDLQEAAMKRMTKLEHFSHEVGWTDVHSRISFDHGFFKQLIASWPHLVSLKLVNTIIRPPRGGLISDTPSVYPAGSHLRQIVLSSLAAEEMDVCLIGLPTSFTHLSIDADSLFWDASAGNAIVAPLEVVAPQLRSFSLLDSLWHADDTNAMTAERGRFDPVFAKLDNVQRVALNPVTVTNLSSSLSGLAHLTDVRLEGGAASSEEPVMSGEVAEYLSRQTGLRRLSVNRLLWHKWGAEGMVDLEGVARREGVELCYGD